MKLIKKIFYSQLKITFDTSIEGGEIIEVTPGTLLENNKVEYTTDGRIKCGTGIHVATEDRDSITIRPNSRITKMGLVIANSPCTIDESYRGEIFVVFRPIDSNAMAPAILVGDVIGQLEVPHHRQASFKTVKTLEELGITDRGDGAFGSTSNK